MLAKGAGIATSVLALGVATWLGLRLSVAVAGGGIGAGNLAAQSLHLACLGLAFGALALALSAQRGLAAGGSAATAVLMFLINGFAPVVAGLHWLKYLTLFYYYEGKNPLTTGLHPGGLAVLPAVTAALTAAAAARFAHRDLRG